MILDPAIRLVTQFANDRFQFLAEPKYDLLAQYPAHERPLAMP